MDGKAWPSVTFAIALSRSLRISNEAPTTITSCPNCMLDTGAVASAAKAVRSGICNRSPGRSRLPAAVCHTDTFNAELLHAQDANTVPECELRLDRVLSQKAFDYLVDSEDIVHSEYEQVSQTVVMSHNRGLAMVYIARYRGHEGWSVKRTLSQTTVCPGMVTAKSLETNASPESLNARPVGPAFREPVTVLEGIIAGLAVLRVRRYDSSGLLAAKAELINPSEPVDDRMATTIRALCTTGIVPDNIGPYLEPGLLQGLRSICRPARDIVSVRNEGMVYNAKADGVRQWCISIGSVWYFVLPYRKGKIVRAIGKPSLDVAEGCGAVIDLEAMNDGR